MVLELRTVLENFIAGLLLLLSSIFIQIAVEGDWLDRRRRCCLLFINRRLLDTNGLNLFEMIPQNLIHLGGLLPALSLLVDGRDGGVLDDDADVNWIVHLTEETQWVIISHTNIWKQLDPESLQLIGVVLEQVKVVTDSGQYFIEALLSSIILFRFQSDTLF